MKKILSTVAALGLIAGVATTASALEFSVAGEYFVEGVYMSSGNGEGLVLNDDDQGNDSYWRHEFKIRPAMQVNEHIAVKSVIYLANSDIITDGGDGIWGSQGDGDSSIGNGNNISVQQLYMDYLSPVGKVRVGRTSSQLWQGDFLSSDEHANRLMFFPNFMGENVGACVFLEKTEERDGVAASNGTDSDSDLYEATVWYKTSDMIVAFGYDYYRDAALKFSDPVLPNTDDNRSDVHEFKGYYNQNFSQMYVEAEVQFQTGTFEPNGNNDIGAGVGKDVDVENLGFMADVGMNMDRVDVGIMFIYGTGDSDGREDGDLESLGQLGEQFQPYNILTGANTGMMITDVHAASEAMTQAGIISLGVHGSFAVSDSLSVNSAIAYAQAEDEQTGWDDEYGWEIDFGVVYDLMENLTYQVDFGYLMTGDFFAEDAGSGLDAEDVYSLTHRLTMEF